MISFTWPFTTSYTNQTINNQEQWTTLCLPNLWRIFRWERQSDGYDRREKIVLKKCGEGESELNTLIAVVQHNWNAYTHKEHIYHFIWLRANRILKWWEKWWEYSDNWKIQGRKGLFCNLLGYRAAVLLCKTIYNWRIGKTTMFYSRWSSYEAGKHIWSWVSPVWDSFWW